MTKRTRMTLTAGLALVLALAAPLSASAHIRLTPGQIAAGTANVQLTFSVPTEAADSPNGETTVLVRVALSSTHPFGSVYVQPVAGWTGKVETTALPKPVTVDGKKVAEAVTAVVWTAEPGQGIPKGSFQNFVISVTPIPDVGRLSMPATQQFSSGAVQNWNQPMPHGKGTAPDHPAPTLYVDESPPTLTGGMTMGGMAMSGSTVADSRPDSPSSSSTIAVALAAGGLVAGISGLVLGFLAFRRTRRGVAG